MLRLIAFRHNEIIDYFELPKREALLGSAPDNNLVFPYETISKRHARLRPARLGYELLDLGSKNGLRVEGVRVSLVILRPGLLVQMGEIFLQLEEADTVEAVGAPLGLAPSPAGPEPPESTETCESTASPAEAPGLLRELARMPAASTQDRRKMLRKVRPLIRAEAIVLLEKSPSGGAVVLECQGGMPPDELRTLEQALADCRSREISTPGGAYALAVSRTLQLIARFSPKVSRIEKWKRDVLGFLLDRFDIPAPDMPDESAPEPLLRFPNHGVRGNAPAMRAVHEQLRAALASRHPILFQGETGVGKGFFARVIHDSGPAADGPFLIVDCSDPQALPAILEQANAGSLLLDEIGGATAEVQAAILRLLDLLEREPRPVRILVSTRHALDQRVAQGEFRDDLWYRLNVLPIRIPPLRERRDDIPAFVQVFADLAAKDARKHFRGISAEALRLLAAQEWPGNLWELRSAVAQAVLASPSGSILDARQFRALSTDCECPASEPMGTLEEAERRHISRVLEEAGWNRTRAAGRLGMSRTTLYKKIERYRLF